MATATGAPQNCDLRGLEACLYYNNGTAASPVWVEHLGIVGDLTCTETEDENELTTRNRNRRTKEYTEGDIDMMIGGTQIVDSLYHGWQFLYSMRRNGTSKDVMFLTEPINVVGAVGWRGKMRNFDRTFNAPSSGSQTQNFSLKPAACTDVSVREVRIATANTVANYDPTVVDTLGTTTTII